MYLEAPRGPGALIINVGYEEKALERIFNWTENMVHGMKEGMNEHE
jgi:hypothetical protein